MIQPRLIKALGLCACVCVLNGCGGGRADDAADDSSGKEVAADTSTYVVDPAIRMLYVAECVLCHGVTGMGDGSMSAMLNPRPRSFVSDEWKFATPDMSAEEQRSVVIGLIADGIPEATMPGYKSTMSEQELAALADYVLSLREKK